MTLRERIHRLYQAHPKGERAEPDHGRRANLGQSWLARTIGMDATTIRLWVRQGRPSEIGELLIQQLEYEAGLRADAPSARAVLDAWRQTTRRYGRRSGAGSAHDNRRR